MQKDATGRKDTAILIDRALTIRPARPDDGLDLARLVNFAGEGMPHHYWSKIAGAAQDPWEVGRQRAARPSGSISYANSEIVEIDGAVAACLTTYTIGSEPDAITDDTPAMFVPIIELENLALSTRYVSVLAAYPQWRGCGIGARLLNRAESRSDNGDMSIIVSDGNRDAYRLYRRCGYRFRASRPMVKEAWRNPGENWLLLEKYLD